MRPISCRLWLFTWLTLTAGLFLFALADDGSTAFELVLLIGFCSALGSIPAWLILSLLVKPIRKASFSSSVKFALLLLLELGICLLYAAVYLYADGTRYSGYDFKTAGTITLVLFGCTCISTLINLPALNAYFAQEDAHNNIETPVFAEYSEPIAEEAGQQHDYTSIISQHKNNRIMENEQTVYEVKSYTSTQSNKVLIKALITAGLILGMLIPTYYVSNFVKEREQRQKEVVNEVSSKWGAAQTITGPYIVVPYMEYGTAENKSIVIKKSLVLLPETLNVNCGINAQQNHRSIYNVLLYKSNISGNGIFNIKLPQDVDVSRLLLNEARICIGLNDFKGIEGSVVVNFNNTPYELTAGLPSHQVDENGLSAPITFVPGDLKRDVSFRFSLTVKGSEQLSFVPLSGNSSFTLQSTWQSPSFNGNTLPAERQVSDKGFTAKWVFNKANLPYGTVLKDDRVEKAGFSFGVSMLQPADQYAKTMRSVKYAILFIGLTFSLFFIVELTQKKPVHPVQYILVGLALVIFYTLLLSISEFILFDYAYLIAATATVLLITPYSKGHFRSWKIASVFGAVLSALYSFTFVLIRLEDTALLAGSIGLFVIIAIVMYASRKINWYNTGLTNPALEPAA